MLTPMDIHNHQFKKSLVRGYNENEVDDFLDTVVDDFEKILSENDRLKNKLYAAENEVAHYRKLEKTLNDTLMIAQRTADEVITSARKSSEELRESTERECKNIRDRAQLEAKQLVDSATIKRDAILAEYEKFVREKNSFLMKLRVVLESELTMTKQMLNDMPEISESVKNIQPEPEPVEESEPAEEPAPDEEPAPETEETPDDDEDGGDESNSADATTKPDDKEVSDNTKSYSLVKKSATNLDKGDDAQ